jgi:DNA invertase Pin-like site-specific DNA recombinase
MLKARRILRESNETLREGYGFSNQKEDCLKFEQAHGIEVVKECQLVESSSTWKREEFERILDEAIAEKGEMSVIVFPRVDRFARNLEAAGYYLGKLRQHGLVLMFAQENLVVDDEASAMQVLIFFIHSFKADQDGKQIRHNLSGGKDRLAREAHEVPNGMVLFPYDYMSKRLYGQISTGKPTLNKERADMVRQWAKWIIEDGLGITEVARRMNKLGIPTKRGKKWQAKGVREILQSRALIGEFQWKGETYYNLEGETVLSVEEWELVQKRLVENRPRSFCNATKLDYPPMPEMVFHKCGKRMYHVSSHSIPYYRCKQCKRSYTPANDVWNEVRRGIVDALMRPGRLIPAIRAQFNNRDTIERLEGEIKGKENEIQKQEKLKDTAFRLGISLENYSQEKVQEEINKAEAQIQRLEAEKADFEKQRRTLQEQVLNEEGIKRFCQLVGKNIETLSKKQWEVLNKMLRLKVTVSSQDIITVSVALPLVRDAAIELPRLLASA